MNKEWFIVCSVIDNTDGRIIFECLMGIESGENAHDATLHSRMTLADMGFGEGFLVVYHSVDQLDDEKIE